MDPPDHIDLTEPDRSATPRAPFTVVAHHWRTPLTVMLGFLETLITRWDELDPAYRRTMLLRVRDRTLELQRWIEDVLTAMEPRL